MKSWKAILDLPVLFLYGSAILTFVYWPRLKRCLRRRHSEIWEKLQGGPKRSIPLGYSALAMRDFLFKGGYRSLEPGPARTAAARVVFWSYATVIWMMVVAALDISGVWSPKEIFENW